MSAARSLQLRSGGTLDYFVAGDVGPHTDGGVIVYHHGTPAAGPIGADFAETANALGMGVVEVVRPGYGASSRQAGRRVVDVVPLVEELLDHLGVDRFVTMGWSGGGPHALATAARLPERCAAAMCLASVGPFGEPDLDFLAGMGQDNIDEFGAALAGPQELQAFLSAMAEVLRDVTAEDVVASLNTLLPDADRAYLVGSFAEEMAEELRWSLSEGIWGWYDDDMAFCEPWGFELSELTVPVEIWQGSADLMVPFAHGRWLADRIPTSIPQLHEGEGHLSLSAKALAPGFGFLRRAWGSGANSDAGRVR